MLRYFAVTAKDHPKGRMWARKNNEHPIVYPKGFLDIDFKVLVYVDKTGEGGNLIALCCADDVQAEVAQVIQAGDAREMTKDEITAFSEANEIRIETVTDEGKLRRLEIKSHLTPEQFTQEDWDALDPTKDSPGLQYSRIFADRIARL